MIQTQVPHNNRFLHRMIGKTAVEFVRASLMLDFVLSGYGKAYGVTARQRAWLLLRFHRNVRAIPSGTGALLHLVMAREILSIPVHKDGDVVECGTWKGASAASLSLVCHLTGRRLLVCDSFEGLPDVGVQTYVAPYHRRYGYLRGGLFEGPLAEVQANIETYGRLQVCGFLPGYFSDTLHQLSRPIAFAFLDVDLESSFRDCLRAIWPLLVDNGTIYADDIGCMNLAGLFFDESWWQQNLKCAAPGLVGSGCGLPVSPRYSNFGFTRKTDSLDFSTWQRDPDLLYPD